MAGHATVATLSDLPHMSGGAVALVLPQSSGADHARTCKEIGDIKLGASEVQKSSVLQRSNRAAFDSAPVD